MCKQPHSHFEPGTLDFKHWNKANKRNPSPGEAICPAVLSPSRSLAAVLTPCSTPPDSIDTPYWHFWWQNMAMVSMSICVTHIARVFPSACWKVLMTLLEREFGLPGVNFHFSPQHPAKHLNHKSVSTWIFLPRIWSTQYHESSVPCLGSHSRVRGTFQEKRLWLLLQETPRGPGTRRNCLTFWWEMSRVST